MSGWAIGLSIRAFSSNVIYSGGENVSHMGSIHSAALRRSSRLQWLLRRSRSTANWLLLSGVLDLEALMARISLTAGFFFPFQLGTWCLEGLLSAIRFS
jgi:hypothetical protein